MSDTIHDESFFEAPAPRQKSANMLAFALGYVARGIGGFLHWLIIGSLIIVLRVVLFIMWKVAIWAALGCGVVAAEMYSAHQTMWVWAFGAGALAFLVARYWLNGVFRPMLIIAPHE